MKQNLREKLKSSIVVGDGAMGTYLYQLGLPVGISYEELNLSQPEIIERVHREYYDAGARFIETNTYSANRERLSKYGLEADVEKINRAGVDIARRAVGSDAYVVGSVGSIRAGKRKNLRTSQVEADFTEQIEVLIDASVDGILLETFYDLDEIMLALKIVRQFSDLPVICQLAMEDVGRTSDGYLVSEAFEQLVAAGADVVGFNCRTGPNGIIRVLENTRVPDQVPVSVFPNAGIPDYIDGRYHYVSTPAYFAESALRFANLGARVIGGCCGTTPAHIQAIAEALHQYIPTVSTVDSTNEKRGSMVSVSEPSMTPLDARADRSDELSIVELVKKRHTVIVELDPPRDLDITKFMAGAAALKAAGADAVTMADNSLAVTRMSNLALGSLIKDRVGIRSLIHIACRDRNLIGTQSHLMGLDALGIDHVLAVTGDPAKFGDLPVKLRL